MQILFREAVCGRTEEGLNVAICSYRDRRQTYIFSLLIVLTTKRPTDENGPLTQLTLFTIELKILVIDPVHRHKDISDISPIN